MAKWNSDNTYANVASYSDDPTVIRLIRLYRLRIAAVILIIAAALFFGAKPAYQRFRQNQIDNNLEEAVAAARVEDWGTARDKARSVLIARPSDFNAYRIWFQALAAMGEQRTYLVAATMFMDPRTTREERLDALRVMTRQAPQAVALRAFASLDEQTRQRTDVRAMVASLLIYRGEFEVAEQMLRAARELESHPEARLELVRVLCARPTFERIDEARMIFAKLIEEDCDAAALECLLLLSQAPGGLAAGAPLPDLVAWVESQPMATTLHHLVALHPLLDHASADARQAHFNGAVSRFLAVDPGVVGEWLLRHEQVDRVVELLAEPAKSSGIAYICYLRALLKLKESAKANQLLKEPPSSVDLVDLELVRAAAARIQGDAAAEAHAWNQALLRAVFDQSRNRFVEIADYASQLGANQVVDDAWVAAVRIGWGRLPLYQDLEPVLTSLARQDRTADLLAMCRTLMRFEAENPNLINNYHYLGLLHGVTPPKATISAFRELLERFPERNEFRSGLAMGLLMDGQAAAALEQIAIFDAATRANTPVLGAMEGAALALEGKLDESRKLLGQIDWRRLLRVESLALRVLLSDLGAKDLPLPDLTEAAAAIDPEQTPAWKKAVERLEKDRANDVLPELPALSPNISPKVE